jgi:hypothetical protein
MQKGLPAAINIMKTLHLSLALLLLPFVFHAQSLTGLWMGKMTNDSNTVRKDDEYEIVLTEYKNKVYGYTRSTFFVEDNLYYIVKKVEGVIIGNICEVKDAGIIMHNFPQKPEKKVKVTYTFRRNTADSTWNLDGEWKTNTTKKYYSISGKSDLSQEKDLSKSKILPHLEELKKTEEIAFYNEWKKENESIASKDNSFKQEFLKSLVKADPEKNTLASATIKPEPAVNTYNKTAQPLIEIIPEQKKTDVALEKQVVGDSKTSVSKEPIQINTNNKTSAEMAEIKVEKKKTDVAIEKQEDPSGKINNTTGPVLVNTSNRTSAEMTEIKVEEKKTAINTEKQFVEPNTNNKQPVYVDTKIIKGTEVTAVRTETKKTTVSQEKQNADPVQINQQTGYLETTSSKPPVTIAKTTNVPVADPAIKQQALTPEALKINIPVLNTDAAKAVAEREFDKPQEINFTSDSLVLALFDNGEVDGDTVSVLLNGEVIVARQCLKTVAFKKTIYIPAGDFQANIVLYAENLGAYPPNTGLLVVIDGEERHNIRFSADYNKNSAIILKRKK